MANQGTLVEYVYSELQVVGSGDLEGRHVMAVRLNFGPIAPSKVLILGMGDAVNLYNDLGKVLRRYIDGNNDDEAGAGGRA